MTKLKWSGVNLLFSLIFLILCFASESPTERLSEEQYLTKYTIFLGIDLFILYLIWFIFLFFNKNNVSFVLSKSFKIINYIFGGLAFLFIFLKCIFFIKALFILEFYFFYLLDASSLFMLLCNILFTIILLVNIKTEKNIYQKRNSKLYQIIGLCALLSFSYTLNMFTMNTIAELFDYNIEFTFSNIFCAVNGLILYLILLIFNIIIRKTTFYYINQDKIKIFNYCIMGIGVFFILFDFIVNFAITLTAEYIGYVILSSLSMFILAWTLFFTIISIIKVIKEKII